MKQPLTACLHLPPSPGCRGFLGRAASLDAVARDLEAVLEAGFDGVLLENDADKPHSLTVGKPAVAWLAMIALEARRRIERPLGIGVQRIDWEAALSIAAAACLDMVRLDVFVDRVRMEGQVVEIDPARVRALRTDLGIDRVALWTDVHVKHAELIGGGSLAASATAAVEQGSGAVLVTGGRTGEPPTVSDLDAARGAAAGRVPVLVASGLDTHNAGLLAAHCDGAIVGTALKEGDRVSGARAAQVVRAWRGA